MQAPPQVAVVVVSYNTRELLLECIASVVDGTEGTSTEIVVVDNASSDGSYNAVRDAYPQVIAIHNSVNLGFGAACNQGIRSTGSPFILLLNSDARLTREAFDVLLGCLEREGRCAAAGCRLTNADGDEAINTRNFLTPLNQAFEMVGFKFRARALSRSYRPVLDSDSADCSVDWIDGACLILRRAALDEIGLFDERFFMYSEDEDLCLRLKKRGWLICFCGAATVVHHGAASSEHNRIAMLRQFYLSQMMFLSKHRGRLSAFLYTASMKAVLILKPSLIRNSRRREMAREQLTAVKEASRPSQAIQGPSTRLGTKWESIVWRSFTHYGRIKYRYLLPVYRLFGRLPNQQRADGTLEPSRTLRRAQALVRILHRSLNLDQQRMVMERLQQRKGAVIFLPSIGWDIVNTQRAHHLAREFARQGYVSIFDSSNSYDDVSGFKEIEPNLFLFRGSDSILREIADPILWTVTYNYDRRDAYATSVRTVYDWIDELDVFHFDRSFLERNHHRAVKEATLVVSVARRLYDKVAAVRPDALYLPNAVEYEHFASQYMPLPDDPDVDSAWRDKKPIAGYYGAIAEWFDYDLLDAVARLRPDWNFLLIGPMYDNSLRERGRSMLRRNNVRWIGTREYQELPGYLRLFDVAMIPFVINTITLATSPLKLYEYFAGGKPVIATPMPECQAFDEVHTVRSAEEFSEALDLARSEGQDKQIRDRLRNLAHENSWTVRVKSVIEHLQDAGNER